MRKLTQHFEGYYDVKSGYEFSMPVLLTFPNKIYFEGGNVGKCEEIIEDFMIDLSNNLEWKDEKGLDRDVIESDLTKARNGSKRFNIWSAVVEYNLEDPCEYEIITRMGF